VKLAFLIFKQQKVPLVLSEDLLVKNLAGISAINCIPSRLLVLCVFAFGSNLQKFVSSGHDTLILHIHFAGDFTKTKQLIQKDQK
jgi:hypothetical protein